MPSPVIGSVAQDLYDSMEPIVQGDSERNYPAKTYVGALGLMVQEISDIVRDGASGEPGWYVIVDLTLCPEKALDWLGQFRGVRLPSNLSASEKRLRIQTVDGFKRGTPGSILAAAARSLTGTKTVVMHERYGGAWKLRITTLDSETPSPDQVTKDILTQKPAGITLNYETLPGQDCQSVFDNFTDYTDVDSSYSDYDHLHLDY